MNFTPSEIDLFLYLKVTEHEFIVVKMNMDDFMVIATIIELLDEIYKPLLKCKKSNAHEKRRTSKIGTYRTTTTASFTSFKERQ